MIILCVGPLWRGSNAGGLFRALSRSGCIIEVIDEFYFISLKAKQTKNKIIEKLIRPFQEKEFNAAIKKSILTLRPEVLFIYKGAFVTKDTLHFAKSNNCKLALFFPDVSMTNHGKNIPECIPLYDIIFTTKTFGITDLYNYYGVKNAIFIPHGFDPEIHRRITVSKEMNSKFDCDVSFIGTYSPKKEEWLIKLKAHLPHISIKVWGDQWNKAGPELKSVIQGIPVTGDFYAIAIQCSKINLGILSEAVKGSSVGDNITSRTFHIPASYGFMLHERNEESLQYYDEYKEAGFFEGADEMIDKVKYYLENTGLREAIRDKGYECTWKENSLDNRADTVISYFNNLTDLDKQ